jgi:hypothetical protein
VTVERPSEGDTTIAVTEAGAARISYRATFAQAPLVAPPGAPARLENAPVDVAEAYDSWLFHGPSLRGIAAIEAAGPEGVDAVLTVPETPAIAEHETGAGATDYVLDPVLVDSAFQLSIVWARTQADATTLPAGFRRMRRFAPVGAGPLRCTLRGRPGPAGANLEVTLELRHPGGAPVLLIEGAEFTATRSLNRLADAAAGGTLR